MPPCGPQVSRPRGSAVPTPERIDHPVAISPGQSLLVARGKGAKPAFDTLALPTEPPATAADVVVSLRPVGGILLPAAGGAAVAKARLATGTAAEVDGSIQQASRQAAALGSNFTVLGTDNIGQPVVTRIAAEASAGRRKRGPEEDKEEAEAAGTRCGTEGADEEVPDLPEGEVPLGERVARLEAKTLGVAPSADKVAGPIPPMPLGSSTADSLSVLLTQAIRR